MKLRIKTIMASCVIAGTAVMATATPAAANQYDCNLNSAVRANGGYACFEANGDHIWIHDTASDSASAIAYWQVSNGTSGSCTNSLGGGAWKDCNYNFDEDYQVRLKVRVYDRSENQEIDESYWSHWVSVN